MRSVLPSVLFSLQTPPRRPTMRSAEFTSNSAGTIWPFSNFRLPQICPGSPEIPFQLVRVYARQICRKKPQRREGPLR